MALKIIPTVIMLEAFVAAIAYFIKGKPGTGLYWLSAALLNLAVIYLIPGE